MANIQEQENPHFVLLPFMAQGHMIPTVDIARLLAQRNITVTVLTTPENSNRFKTAIDRASKSGLGIRFINLKFPSVEAGLPQGCENVDMLPSIFASMNFFKAVAMLKDQVQELLQQLKPSPTCLMADMMFTWATNVALSLKIPRLMFYGTSCFSLLCKDILETCKDFQGMASDHEHFVVPGFPDRIEVTKAEYKSTLVQLTPEWMEMWEDLRESEVEASGTVVNSFEELEPHYIKHYMKFKGKKVWCVGPVSLCNEHDVDKAGRGNTNYINATGEEYEHILKWLDSQEASSVVYVCLGSLSHMATPQLIELGLGLEASNKPFIWVIRNSSDELETWLMENNFKERINGRGLVINGWAPQLLILSHPSIGGFLTHCGWNSTLEGITTGVPMITWPQLAEQFFNEKLIVNVIKIGIRVGVEVPVSYGGGHVKSGEIKRVVEMLMDGGEEGRERRERARKMEKMAKRAVEEGGSSYLNITTLIRDVAMMQQQILENTNP